MGKTIDIEDFKKEERRRKRKAWFNEKCMDFSIWWSQNKDWAIVVIPFGIGLTAKTLRWLSSILKARYKAKQLDIYYDRRVYDPVMGIKYETKRTMTALDKENFTNLRRNGATVHDALKTLNLI
jgi:hypothetical protein